MDFVRAGAGGIKRELSTTAHARDALLALVWAVLGLVTLNTGHPYIALFCASSFGFRLRAVLPPPTEAP